MKFNGIELLSTNRSSQNNRLAQTSSIKNRFNSTTSSYIVDKGYNQCPGIKLNRNNDFESYSSKTAGLNQYKLQYQTFDKNRTKTTIPLNKRVIRSQSQNRLIELKIDKTLQGEKSQQSKVNNFVVQNEEQYRTNLKYQQLQITKQAFHLTNEPSKYSKVLDFSNDPKTLDFRRFSQNSLISQTITMNTSDKSESQFRIPRSQRQKILDSGRITSSRAFQDQKLMLFVFNQNLINCQINTDLNYCYFNCPIAPPMSNESDACLLFKEMMPQLQQKFKIGTSNLYFFLKNGTTVQSSFDIPSNEYTIIVSTSTGFVGVSVLGGLKLMIFLNQLEKILPTHTQLNNYQSMEQHIKKEYDVTIQEISSLMQGNKKQLNSQQLQYLSEQPTKSVVKYLDSVEPKSISKQQSEFGTKREYIKSNKQIVGVEQLQEVNLIIASYDKQLEEMKKDIVSETNMVLEDVDVVDSNHKQTYRKKVLTEQDSKQFKIQLLQKILQKHNKNHQMFKQDNDVQVAFEKEEKPRILTKFTKKQILSKLDKLNPELYRLSIPELENNTQLTRREIHSSYIMYKVLESISSQYNNKYQIGEGVDFTTFRNGIYQIYMQPHQLAKDMFEVIDFNFSGYLNWQEFLELMVVIKAKTLEERVNLFIKICDKDGNGQLSKDEVYNLTKMCLSRFMSTEGDILLNELCEYFTRLIFSAVNVEINREIPLALIKEAILRGDSESELLTMFCGADL